MAEFDLTSQPPCVTERRRRASRRILIPSISSAHRSHPFHPLVTVHRRLVDLMSTG